MINETRRAFEAIGADVAIETRGRRFEIDVRDIDGTERFALRYPSTDALVTEVTDVKPRLRHLVLDVTGWRLPIRGRYLCGHDERHWFVASLPSDPRTATVRGAMEALKPEIVRREQRRKRVKHRRHRRRTTAYVRQGEWFFLPRPTMHVGELAERNGQLSREGGKPHRVEWIYRPAGRSETFARGAVSHPDHDTIRLQVWHRVVQNNESTPSVEAQRFTRMTYLD
ncbi:MAG: hypothetical protein AAF961_10495 [Planctomycetota bacterium]